MDMVAGLKEQLVFHMTGKSAGEATAAVDVAALLPAALAPYRDLARLRYDYPLVLPDAGGAEPVSLSAAVAGLLGEIAPRGAEGERLRRHALRVEAAIRARVASGEEGTLSAMWTTESAKLGAADAAAGGVLAQAGQSLKVDGAVVECDVRLPSRYLREAWRAAQARKGATSGAWSTGWSVASPTSGARRSRIPPRAAGPRRSPLRWAARTPACSISR